MNGMAPSPPRIEGEILGFPGHAANWQYPKDPFHQRPKQRSVLPKDKVLVRLQRHLRLKLFGQAQQEWVGEVRRFVLSRGGKRGEMELDVKDNI